MGNLRADSTHFQVNMCLMGIPPPHLCQRCHSNRGKMQREKIRQRSVNRICIKREYCWNIKCNTTMLCEAQEPILLSGGQTGRGQDCPQWFTVFIANTCFLCQEHPRTYISSTSKNAHHKLRTQLETLTMDTESISTSKNLKSSLVCSPTTKDVIKIRNMGSKTAPSWFVDFIAT